MTSRASTKPGQRITVSGIQTRANTTDRRRRRPYGIFSGRRWRQSVYRACEIHRRGGRKLARIRTEAVSLVGRGEQHGTGRRLVGRGQRAGGVNSGVLAREVVEGVEQRAVVAGSTEPPSCEPRARRRPRGGARRSAGAGQRGRVNRKRRASSRPAKRVLSSSRAWLSRVTRRRRAASERAQQGEREQRRRNSSGTNPSTSGTPSGGGSGGASATPTRVNSSASRASVRPCASPMPPITRLKPLRK